VTADRKRVNDPETGEIKLVWGLSGVRLRTPEDDFPDGDPGPNNPADPAADDPVDPVPESTGSGHNPDNQAGRSGDPVDSQKVLTVQNEGDRPQDPIMKSFSKNDRITGSGRVEARPKPDRRMPARSDPVATKTRGNGKRSAIDKGFPE
jgi:hypothetical protein